MTTKDSGRRHERTKAVLLPSDLGDKHAFDFYVSLLEFVLKPEPDAASEISFRAENKLEKEGSMRGNSRARKAAWPRKAWLRPWRGRGVALFKGVGQKRHGAEGCLALCLDFPF